MQTGVSKPHGTPGSWTCRRRPRGVLEPGRAPGAPAPRPGPSAPTGLGEAQRPEPAAASPRRAAPPHATHMPRGPDDTSSWALCRGAWSHRVTACSVTTPRARWTPRHPTGKPRAPEALPERPLASRGDGAVCPSSCLCARTATELLPSVPASRPRPRLVPGRRLSSRLHPAPADRRSVHTGHHTERHALPGRRPQVQMPAVHSPTQALCRPALHPGPQPQLNPPAPRPAAAATNHRGRLGRLVWPLHGPPPEGLDGPPKRKGAGRG